MLLHKLKSFAVMLCLITMTGLATAAYAQDNSDQVSAWRQAATAGDAEAAMNLADTYRQGWGVQKDEEEAFKWYLQAAAGNILQAQFIVGRAYATGQGLKQDFNEAANWYRKAALRGHAAAQKGLGDAYFYGRGVELDKATGLGWYQKAANQDNAEAEYSLAEAYHNGDGVAKNDKLAAEFYQRAVDHGNALANAKLSDMDETQGGGLFSLLATSTQAQLIFIVAVFGSIFFLIKIRKQGTERYKLNFFISSQFGLLIFGSLFFYITSIIAGSCDPNGQDIHFCQSMGHVGMGVAPLTMILALIMNIKQSNPVFGALYTVSQAIAAYTFIPAVVMEALKNFRGPVKKKA